MAKVEGIAGKMLGSLNELCDTTYKGLSSKFKALIEDTMKSAGLKEIDFTRGTRLAKDGIKSKYSCYDIRIVKMTYDDAMIAFHYYNAEHEPCPSACNVVTYDDFMSGNRHKTMGYMESIIREIINVVLYLSQTKEIVVNLPNGISINCQVPRDMLKEDCNILSLIRYLEVQTGDTIQNFERYLNAAIDKGNYTVEEKE